MSERDTSPEDETPSDPEVVEWVANLAERVQGGETIDLDALAAEFPERASVLRSLLPSMITLTNYARFQTGTPTRHAFPGGRLTLGEFQFVREIGRGGMGVVYEAIQTSLKRPVALKVLPLVTAANPRHLERFQVESRTVASLRHEHIVPVFSVGCEDDIPYYAMQMIEGCSLAEVLQAMRKEKGVCLTDADEPGLNSAEMASELAVALTSEFNLDTVSVESSSHEETPTTPGLPAESLIRRNRSYPRTVADLGIQAADALRHAHENRIIHRDIKPGNLLLDRRGHLWVTDFGLARMLDDATVTRTGDLVGTLRYMSPEQAFGNRDAVDGRTDVYSLGITLYELLTMRPAFGGTNRAETLRDIARSEPKAIRALSPSVPRDLETIIEKAIAKEPRDRYQSAGDLADDLRRFLEGRPIQARRRTVVDRMTKMANRNRPVVIAATVTIALGILGAVGQLVWSNNLLLKLNRELTEERNRSRTNAESAEANRAEAERQRDEAERQRRLSDQHLYGERIRQAFESLSTNQPERAQEILRDLAGSSRPNIPLEFAWFHLWRQSRRDVIVLTDTSEETILYAMSDDGQTLVTYHHDGSIRIRDPSTGAIRATLSERQSQLRTLNISGDGQLIATAVVIPERNESQIGLWSAATGDRLAYHVSSGSLVGGMQFDASGRYLWVESRLTNAEQIWLSEVWTLGGESLQPTMRSLGAWDPIAMTRDRHLAVLRGADNHAFLLDLWSGTSRPFPMADRELRLAALSPDGRLFAGRETGSQDLVVWDVATCWEQTRFHPLNLGEPFSIHFSDDNQTLGIRDDRGGFSTHDVVTNRDVSYPNDAIGPVTLEFSQMVFSPDGRRVALSSTFAGQPPMPPRVHDVPTGELLRSYPGRSDRVGLLTFRPDGQSLFFIGREQLYRWMIEPSPAPLQPRGHSDEAWCVAFSPDSQLFVTGSDDTDEPMTLKVWNTRDGGFVRGWKPHDATVSSVAISPDGQTVVTASLEQQGNLCLWDLDSGRLLADYDGHLGAVRSVAYSPDGQILASAGFDRVVRLWNTSTNTILRVLEGHEHMVRQVAFSPSGDRIVSVGNDKSIRLWDTGTGRMLKVWRGSYNFTAVRFAPDGKTLASADSSGHVEIRDVETGEILQTMASDDDELLTLAFSPDGRTLASAGRSPLIRLWDPTTGQELARLSDHRAQVNALAFSPDGSTLASCRHDGHVHLWRGKQN